MSRTRLRLERLEDRNAPSDVTAMEPLPPPTPGVVPATYYPNFGTGSSYDTHLPIGTPFYFLGNPTTPQFLTPPPPTNPLIPPEVLLV